MDRGGIQKKRLTVPQTKATFPLEVRRVFWSVTEAAFSQLFSD